jgi:hypothetical protein
MCVLQCCLGVGFRVEVVGFMVQELVPGFRLLGGRCRVYGAGMGACV